MAQGTLQLDYSSETYFKAPSGFFMQMGRENPQLQANSTSDFEIIFPYIFKTIWYVVAWPWSLSSGASGNVLTVPTSWYNGKTTIRITNRTSGTLTVNFCWIAIGRWK